MSISINSTPINKEFENNPDRNQNPVAHPYTALSEELVLRIGESLDPGSYNALSLADWSHHRILEPFRAALHRRWKSNPIPLQIIRELMVVKPDIFCEKKCKIDISGSDVTDDELKLIVEKLPNIIEINASKCPNITEAGLGHISKLTNLSRLNLSENNITDAGLAHLAKLTNLTHLFSTSDQITDIGLEHLSKLPNLSFLFLSKCQITDAGLAHLSKIKELTGLVLRNCSQITDTGLAHLSKIKHLSYLDLSRCFQITNDGLSHLASLKKLTGLFLSHCDRITDEGLICLSKLPHLSSLYLLSNQITDAGLAHLSKLNLTNLGLENCDLTNAGLTHLISLSKLSSLHLIRCAQITLTGFACLSHIKKIKFVPKTV